MFVIGTAGHVDHGKSALVLALTGIDPDRLPEEKQRGLTIDLGFAWLQLPSGRQVSIIDVPGHERFIKNMLAGVGGIDLAILVVAADESVMPQTREHLAILDLLGVEHGLVAISKKDLVDDEWLELVVADVEDTVEPTTLADAPILAVSAVTGEGLAELLATIDRLIDEIPPKQDIGRPRLSIDRIFTMTGFGTVVTGTLVDGSLSVGQGVEIVPPGLRSRIRGLQSHQESIEQASPGHRLAINLSGIAANAVSRGDVVTTPGWLTPTTAVDARLRLLDHLSAPLAHNVPVSFHTGAAEAMGRLRLLESDELQPGATGWAQVHLDRPLAIARGDLFILRSSEDTIGGGRVVETHARRHRRRHAPTLEMLARLEKGAPEDVALNVLSRGWPLDMSSLVRASGLTPSQAQAAVALLAGQGELISLGGDASDANALLISREGWADLKLRCEQAVAEYHAQYPLRLEMPKEQLRQRVSLSPRAFAASLDRLEQEGSLIVEGASVRLSGHEIRFTPSQQAEADAFVRALAENPYSPPTENLPNPEVLAALVEQGPVIKVAEGIFFAAEAYGQMVDRVVDHLRRESRITVGQVRDMFGTSRKYALPFMEHLDKQGVTRRVGDERRLR